jgi:hypothetical protein
MTRGWNDSSSPRASASIAIWSPTSKRTVRPGRVSFQFIVAEAADASDSMSTSSALAPSFGQLTPAHQQVVPGRGAELVPDRPGQDLCPKWLIGRSAGSLRF